MKKIWEIQKSKYALIKARGMRFKTAPLIFDIVWVAFAVYVFVVTPNTWLWDIAMLVLVPLNFWLDVEPN